MMKKSRNSRRRTAKLTRKDISRCEFFASEGRRINAAKTILAFRNGNDKIVAKTIIYNDKECDIVRWFDHRYYTIPYHSQLLYAKPYRMTLAKYEQLNGNLAK